mmetsp:Transcript_95854/g.268353  ORF Transcript_95854/g.268353 Transcript_95854/m.268353 type:complete len:268 (+) Transcript_95854:178-981(+)
MVQRSPGGRASISGGEGEQVLAQVAGLREARPGLALEVDLCALQLLVHVVHGGAATPGVARLVAEHIAAEGHIARHEDVQDDPDAPQIGGRGVLPLQRLGRDVPHGPNDVFRLGAVWLVLLARVEIDQLNGLLRLRLLRRRRIRSGVMKHDVLRLDVSVDQATRVDVVDGLQDLSHDPLALPLGHIHFCLQEVEQLAAAAFLHDDVVAVLVLYDVVQTQHIAVSLEVQHAMEDASPNSLAAYGEFPRSHLDDDILARLVACRSGDLT